MMKFKRFDKITGYGFLLAEIAGQSRYYLLFDYKGPAYEDAVANHSKTQQFEGSTLQFYDLEKEKMYEPISAKANVTYSLDALFLHGRLYFLQADMNNNSLNLYEYLPGESLEKKFSCNIDDLDLYNPHLVAGDHKIYIVGEEKHNVATYIIDNAEFDQEIFEIGIYPKQFRVKNFKPTDELCLIEGQRLYFDSSIEEYDDQMKYVDFHDEIIVKDFTDKIVNREKGSLKLMPDGHWWIM